MLAVRCQPIFTPTTIILASLAQRLPALTLPAYTSVVMVITVFEISRRLNRLKFPAATGHSFCFMGTVGGNIASQEIFPAESQSRHRLRNARTMFAATHATGLRSL